VRVLRWGGGQQKATWKCGVRRREGTVGVVTAQQGGREAGGRD